MENTQRDEKQHNDRDRVRSWWKMNKEKDKWGKEMGIFKEKMKKVGSGLAVWKQTI